MPPAPESRTPPPMQLRRITLFVPTGPSKCDSTLSRSRELLITLPCDEVVAGGRPARAAEDQALAVGVDHVPRHVGAAGVRVELHALVGVVVDPIADQARVTGHRHVDALLEVGGRQRAAVVDAVALDRDALRNAEALVAEGEADRGVVVGHVVVGEQDAPAVDDGAGRLTAVAPVEVEPAYHEARGAPVHDQPAHHPRALTRARLERDRASRFAGATDRRRAEVRAGAQAAGLPGAQGVHQPLCGPVGPPERARVGVRPAR